MFGDPSKKSGNHTHLAGTFRGISTNRLRYRAERLQSFGDLFQRSSARHRLVFGRPAHFGGITRRAELFFYYFEWSRQGFWLCSDERGYSRVVGKDSFDRGQSVKWVMSAKNGCQRLSGFIFLLLFLIAVWLLKQIPQPAVADIEA